MPIQSMIQSDENEKHTGLTVLDCNASARVIDQAESF